MRPDFREQYSDLVLTVIKPNTFLTFTTRDSRGINWWHRHVRRLHRAYRKELNKQNPHHCTPFFYSLEHHQDGRIHVHGVARLFDPCDVICKPVFTIPRWSITDYSIRQMTPGQLKLFNNYKDVAHIDATFFFSMMHLALTAGISRVEKMNDEHGAAIAYVAKYINKNVHLSQAGDEYIFSDDEGNY